jgi:hypothetical protein
MNIGFDFVIIIIEQLLREIIRQSAPFLHIFSLWNRIGILSVFICFLHFGDLLIGNATFAMMAWAHHFLVHFFLPTHHIDYIPLFLSVHVDSYDTW